MVTPCRIIYDNIGKLAEYDGDGNLLYMREGAWTQINKAPNIIRDLEPYKSMITGEMITSRSHHREHLRQHGCIEVGNEKMESKPVKAKNTRRKVLHQQLADMSDRQANKLIKQLKREARG